MTVISGKPLRQVAFGHPQAARVPIADVEHDQWSAVEIVRDFVNFGGAAEPMHDPKPDTVSVQHWSKNAAHGALLGPDFDSHRLLIPIVAPVAVVRQSTVDQISPVPLFALLHRPVFDRMVDWLAVTLDRRISAFETVGVTVGHRSC
jgi:hypothetical protein